jgi:hypothetical protein
MTTVGNSGLHIISAGVQSPTQEFYSGDVDFMSMSWVNRLSAESISASGVSAFLNWYFPAGVTGYLSGTGVGASSMWVKLSATAAPGTVMRVSAKVLTTSAKTMVDWFDLRISTGA